MSKSSARPQYAPLPMRALLDGRLTGGHLRLLLFIAAHDRLSLHRGSGAGCFLSNKQLSARTGLSYARIATMLNELERWSYVQRSPLERDARRKTARVIYNAGDGEAFKAFRDADLVCMEANNPGENVAASANEHENIVCRGDKEADEIVCIEHKQFAQNHRNFGVNSNTSIDPQYITPRGEIDSVKQGNRFTEGAPRYTQRLASQKLKTLWESLYPVGRTTAVLSEVSREAKSMPIWDPLLLDALENLVSQTDHAGLQAHALRLLNECTDNDAYESWMKASGRFVRSDVQPIRQALQ
jgi:hypothetical protein